MSPNFRYFDGCLFGHCNPIVFRGGSRRRRRRGGARQIDTKPAESTLNEHHDDNIWPSLTSSKAPPQRAPMFWPNIIKVVVSFDSINLIKSRPQPAARIVRLTWFNLLALLVVVVLAAIDSYYLCGANNHLHLVSSNQLPPERLQ